MAGKNRRLIHHLQGDFFLKAWNSDANHNAKKQSTSCVATASKKSCVKVESRSLPENCDKTDGASGNTRTGSNKPIVVHQINQRRLTKGRVVSFPCLAPVSIIVSFGSGAARIANIRKAAGYGQKWLSKLLASTSYTSGASLAESPREPLVEERKSSLLANRSLGASHL